MQTINKKHLFEVITAARPHDFDLLVVHARLRHARGLARLGRDRDLPPRDVGQSRHRREKLGSVAQTTVVFGAHEQMNMRRAGRGEFLVDVALAIGDHGHHRRAAQHAVRRAHAVNPAPSFLALDRARDLALPLSFLPTPRRCFLPAAYEGVREPQNAARVAHLTRIAGAGVDDDHRMQKKSDVATIPDHAKAALASHMSRKIEFRRILDRQHVAPTRRPRRMIGGGREHDLARHAVIMQKTSKALRPRSVAAKLT